MTTRANLAVHFYDCALPTRDQLVASGSLSRCETTLLAWLERLTVANESWRPQAEQWLQVGKKTLIRPDESTRSTERASPANAKSSGKNAGAGSEQPLQRRPRKCLAQGGQVVYTDQSCPAGTTEQWFDDSGAAVVVSPRP